MWEKSRGSSSLLSDTRHPSGYEPSGFLTTGRDVDECGRKVAYPLVILDARHRSLPVLLFRIMGVAIQSRRHRRMSESLSNDLRRDTISECSGRQ